MEEWKEKITNDLLKDYKKHYLEGAIDIVDAIQKALIKTKTMTGQYPTMHDLIYKLLPEMKEMRKKDLQELEQNE